MGIRLFHPLQSTACILPANISESEKALTEKGMGCRRNRVSVSKPGGGPRHGSVRSAAVRECLIEEEEGTR